MSNLNNAWNDDYLFQTSTKRLFDEIFGRSTLQGDKEFIRQCSEINQADDIFIINCYVNKDIAHKRLLEHNETCPYNYVKAQKILQNIIS